jgi:hypothetical protein
MIGCYKQESIVNLLHYLCALELALAWQKVIIYTLIYVFQ